MAAHSERRKENPGSWAGASWRCSIETSATSLESRCGPHHRCCTGMHWEPQRFNPRPSLLTDEALDDANTNSAAPLRVKHYRSAIHSFRKVQRRRAVGPPFVGHEPTTRSTEELLCWLPEVIPACRRYKVRLRPVCPIRPRFLLSHRRCAFTNKEGASSRFDHNPLRSRAGAQGSLLVGADCRTRTGGTRLGRTLFYR